MIVDGKAIAADIYSEIKKSINKLGKHPCLVVFTCAPNTETKKYLEIKKKKASDLGIDVAVIEFDSDIDTNIAVGAISGAGFDAEGVVVQLPFPSHIDVDRVIAAIPQKLDVDGLHYKGGDTEILPPVVGAVAEIATRENIDFVAKQVAVIGQGRLVGTPAALWARSAGALVEVVGKDTANADEIIKNADIIISGAGSPGLITPDKIKEGVIIFDAGTSEEGGEIKGDADPACANKASLFTPVPGGIGPVTIAVLLRNLVQLSTQ